MPQLDNAIVEHLQLDHNQLNEVDEAILDWSDGVAISQLGGRLSPSSLAELLLSETTSQELVFVDPRVPDVERLLDDIRGSADAERDLTVIVLDTNRDGIDQITEVLAEASDIDAIHIVSHGAGGTVKLGKTWLTNDNLDAYAGQIAQWSGSLASEADLLFYGCNLAATDDGQELLTAIGTLCDCDTAASVDDTGYSEYGGDWDLEYATGVIETGIAFSHSTQLGWQALLATHLVTTTADLGAGSLRQAIIDANAKSGPDTIEFNLSTGDSGYVDPTPGLPGSGDEYWTITPASALPTINDAVTLDATTQAGFSGAPIIELSGNLAGAGADGLWIDSGGDGSTIRGFVINQFDNSGIFISTANNITIEGNYIGTDVTGTLDRGNLEDGISVFDGDYNQIGGTTAAARNIISGNDWNGIILWGGADANVIEGNYIGTDVMGLNAIGNADYGVQIIDNTSDDNRIGGAAPGAGNLISGNLSWGIQIESADRTEIFGNYIGTDVRGSANLGNVGGIRLRSLSTDNRIGGLNPGEANLIAFHSNDGVHVETDQNEIRANAMFGNSGPGQIHLAGGGNPSAVEPTLSSASSGGGTTTVTVSVAGASGINPYEVDLFSNPSNVQEGRVYLGSVTITSGSQVVLLTGEVANNHYLSATATNLSGETSEFSATTQVSAGGGANTAPVLDPTIDVALNPAPANAGAPVGAVGTRIRDLVDLQGSGGKDNVTDPDGGAVSGIAVISADTTRGAWHFSTDDGASWFALGPVSIDSARVLAADAGTRIYFQPELTAGGSISEALHFRAWDQTDGYASGTAGVDTTVNGGTTAYSLVFDSASMTFIEPPPTAVADSYSVDEDAVLDSNDEWFDSNWSHRRTLSFNNLAQTEDLTDFPVLVMLDASRIDYAQTQDNGFDLRFVDSDGSLLAHEIEHWDEAGTSYVWVQVPEIAGGSDTDLIWMYYGNATAPNGENVANVWGTDYKAVWHLDETSGAHFDSTANNQDLTQGGGVNKNASGKIDGADEFDGLNDYLWGNGSDAPLQITGDLTLEAWIWMDSYPGDSSFDSGTDAAIVEFAGFGDGFASDNYLYGLFVQHNGDVALGHESGSGTNHYQDMGVSLGLNQWHQLTAVRDAAAREWNLFLNGVAVGSTFSYSTNTNGGSAADLYIGWDHTYFDGIIDEVRVQDAVRSADWIAAQHASTTDNFITYGYEQSVAGVLANDFDSDGDPLTVTEVNGNAGDVGTQIVLPSGALLTLNADGRFDYDTNGQFDYLDVGETATDTFTYTVDDGAMTDTAVVTITIVGGEDAPVIGGTSTGSVTEDGTLTASGSLTITDVDASDNPVSWLDEALTLGDNGYGDFAITGGAWSYTLNNGHAAVQALDAGETLSDRHTFTASDGSTRLVTITIVGGEDAPVIGGTSTGSVTEDGTLTASGSLTITDVDASDNPVSWLDAALTLGDNGYGDFAITGGAWSYTLNNGHAAVQALDAGETLSDRHTFTASDGSTRQVTITIVGGEDAPVIGGTSTGSVTEDGTLTASGALTITDVDTSDNPISWPDAALTLGDNGYGDFAITGGTWTYTLNNGHAAVQALDAGETLSDRHTFTASDGSTRQVTITIVGGEDAPVIGGTSTGSVTEDGTLTASGALTITDVDTSDNPISWPDAALTLGDNGYGDFAITGGTWTYTLNNAHAAVQALDAGETINDRHTFTASDGSTRLVTITIVGGEDAPVIGGTSTGSVTEDGPLTASGALTITDVDTSDNPISWPDAALTLGDNGYGDFAITGGTWTYTLNNAHAAVQALDAGETINDRHTFTASDGSTRQVTITIVGGEDAPVIGGTSTGSVTEDGPLTASGALTITDVDTSDNPISWPDAALTLGDNGYGDFAITGGTWTYTLNNAHAAVQALDAGETINDRHTFTASDGSTRLVTITIVGGEDAPVIGGTSTGSVTEDGTLTASGALTITDVDTSDNPISWPDAALTLGDNGFGDFQLIGGTWTYTLNNAHAAVQALDAGETINDRHTFTASDGSTRLVTITIVGGEDAPVIGGTSTGSVTEDGTLTASGALTITDVDTSDNPISWPDAALTLGDNGFGDFQLIGGTWTYNLNNAHAAVQALDAGETLNDTHTFTASDGSTRQVTITIVGGEDAPVIAGTSTGSVTEDGMLTANGALTITDVDTSDNPISWLNEASTLSDNGFGDFQLIGGTWTYTLNNAHAAVQALDAGETLNDTHTFTASDGSTRLVAITIVGTNDAPTLAPANPSLGTIDEDSTSAGFTVASIVAGTISDVDVGARKGIAIIGVTGNGTWEYSTDAGATWSAVGTVNATQALLLRDVDQVRYAGDRLNGETATFTYHAWDRTGTTAGREGLKSGIGAISATRPFSMSTNTASLLVTDVNDAPTLAAASPSLGSIDENSTSAGSTVASILGGTIGDVDVGASIGIAIVSVTGNGAWEYSTDAGGSWTGVGVVNSTQALLLRDVDLIRYAGDGLNGEVATFTYRAWDQTGATAGGEGTKMAIGALSGTGPFSNSTNTGSITVTDLNDAPVITPIPDQTISEEGSTGPLSFTVADVDTLVGALVVTASSSDTALIPNSNITLTDLGSGNWTIEATGATDQSGAVTITISASDGVSSTSEAFTVTITPLNDPPVITSPAAVNVVENAPFVMTVTSTDIDGGSPTYAISGGADESLFLIDSTTGNLSFATPPDFELPSDSNNDNVYEVEVTVDDGMSGTSAQVINVTVTPVNESPAISANTGITVSEGSIGNLLGPAALNASDPDDAGVGLTYRVTSSTVNGTVRLGGVALRVGDTFTQDDIDKGRVTYDHDGSESTSDGFSLSLADGGEDGTRTVASTFRIAIVPANDAPSLAGPGVQTPDEDTPWVIRGISVSDPDAGTTDMEVTLTVAHGTLTVDTTVPGGVNASKVTGNGAPSVQLTGTVAEINATLTSSTALVYRGNDDFHGTDTLVVRANDLGNTGSGPSRTASWNVPLVVMPVNDAPVAANDTFSATPDATLTIDASSGVLSNDGDVDGGSLVSVLLVAPSNGTLTLNPDGSFTYTPDAGFSGTDTFTYAASDGGLASTPIVVSLNVSAPLPPLPPPPPVASPSTEPTVEEDNSSADESETSDADSDVAIGPPPTQDSADENPREVTARVSTNESAFVLNSRKPEIFEPTSTSTLIVIEPPGHEAARPAEQAQMQNKAADVLEIMAASNNPLMWHDLDTLSEQVDAEMRLPDIVIGSTAGVTSVLSVGYVVWLLKGGHILAGLLAQMPAWRMIDPLPILAQLGDDEDDENEDDSLQSLLDEKPEDEAAQPSEPLPAA